MSVWKTYYLGGYMQFSQELKLSQNEFNNLVYKLGIVDKFRYVEDKNTLISNYGDINLIKQFNDCQLVELDEYNLIYAKQLFIEKHIKEIEILEKHWGVKLKIQVGFVYYES